MRPRNQCGACDHDFTSVDLFDAHRVGKHAHLYSTEHPDGRRCLAREEMLARGWSLEAGRWFDPAATARAREHFATKVA